MIKKQCSAPFFQAPFHLQEFRLCPTIAAEFYTQYQVKPGSQNLCTKLNTLPHWHKHKTVF